MEINAATIVFSVIGFLAVATVIGYVISVYNNLIEVRNNVEKAFKNIDVLLQQRHDELPKLIDTCKAYMKHESALLLEITKIREHYLKANGSEKKIQAENELNQKMGTLSHRWEQYPDLKASQNFLQTQERISGLESSIADRREFFNDSINIFNIAIQRFPDLIVAKAMSYHTRGYLEVPEEKKEDVKMDFS